MYIITIIFVSLLKVIIFIECDQINQRILGGWYTSIRHFPHHVRLLTEIRIPDSFANDSYLRDICGGSIIHERWIITARHCFRAKIKFVIVGTEETKDMNDTSKIYGISKAFLRWPNKGINMDISLIRLNRTIKFNENVKPVAISPKVSFNSTSLIGKHGIVSGFGLQYIPESFGSFGSLIYPNENKKLKASYGKITSFPCTDYDTFCAIHYGQNGPIFGDSGSGFISFIKNRPFLLGIVSGVTELNFEKMNIEAIYSQTFTHLSLIEAQLADYGDKIDYLKIF